MAKDGDPLYIRVLFGGTSCAIATVVTNPVDLIKVRMQVAQGTGKSRGMFATSVGFVRSKGLLSLWNGLGPSLVRAYVYTGSRLGFYGPWKKAWGCDEHPTSAARKIAAGISSGGIAAAIANPTEVAKVRMQADGARYGGMFQAFRSLVTTGGAFDGIAPHVLRGAAVTASQIGTYDIVKTEVRSRTGWKGVPLEFGCALVAGAVTTTCSSPFDVVKTRVMNSGGSISSSVRGVFADYGALGFFRGWLPNYSRLGPHTTIIMVSYERMNELIMGNVGI
mmetsp:Transcript_4410/g.8474  ORF Transcript_4410/g.8474 Transcript_4410/m.8474 type:complete len:278 (+) Transcript_4410:28-861(+)|eukprot:CAMPEP_0171666310 /NCGR_PEP_ID=MMETSP0990-20121206/48024_1 /TAXON_ID=483369 /ORGANISM="non described non described, Strain CCMP2098" /LENGTH=277 /DNA_ID=CAMNT_0012249797 /DNA_START=38 /DNA_END=871 /DNA_ORIENTATION=+